MSGTLKQIPVFDKTEAAILVMMGVANPFQFSSMLLREEEWAEFPKPVRNPDEESVMGFQRRHREWQVAVGMKVRKRLAYHLSEELKKIKK